MKSSTERPSGGYAKLFSILATLALAVPPALLLLTLILYYAGATGLAKPVMDALFFSSFVSMFAGAVLVLLALVLWLLGAVKFGRVRRGAGIACAAFVVNYFIFALLVYRFYRPH